MPENVMLLFDILWPAGAPFCGLNVTKSASVEGRTISPGSVATLLRCGAWNL